MDAIRFDALQCTKDGLCARICPLRLIVPPSEDRMPESLPSFSQWCIRCGHCVAVCPSQAVHHPYMRSEECPPADYECLPPPDQFEKILRLRRSVRRFKPQPLKKEVLARLIRMAGYGPSSHNRQSVEWLVFKDREDLNHMVDLACDWMRHMLAVEPDAPHSQVFDKIVNEWGAGRDSVLHNAPALLIAHSSIRTGIETIDAAVALSYFDLAAMGFGLGCCWAGLFMMAARSWKPLGAFLALPEHHHLHGALVTGYPQYRFKRLPLRKQPAIQWR